MEFKVRERVVKSNDCGRLEGGWVGVLDEDGLGLGLELLSVLREGEESEVITHFGGERKGDWVWRRKWRFLVKGCL